MSSAVRPFVGVSASELVATLETAQDGITARTRLAMQWLREARFDGDLTLSFRRAQNAPSSLHVKLSTLNKDR